MVRESLGGDSYNYNKASSWPSNIATSQASSSLIGKNLPSRAKNTADVFL
jgi:hypothetical protein